MQEKFRIARQRVDLVNRRLQRSDHVRISRFVETHVAVADLHKAQFTLGRGRVQLAQPAQAERLHHAAIHDAERSRSSPSHAFEKAAPVNPVPVVVKLDLVFFLHVQNPFQFQNERRAFMRRKARRPWTAWTTCYRLALPAAAKFYSPKCEAFGLCWPSYKMGINFAPRQL